ncbi:hypothetical protein DPMN_109743 [Dreissena polymorpha]|uniref:CCHC-type domain-containing protein n=1 Tax=Dreissena polymorpha TaxID=45954 RepID=A0A9D4KB90_DREPO|nr:hypothetical protein DPMN_109743 [Dreissena polymorpha]
MEVSEVKVTSQYRLVDMMVATEKKNDLLEEKMNVVMGKLDKLLARPVISSSPSPSRGQCYNCNELGHFKRDCPKLKNGTPSPARNDRCNMCNESGHMARDCPIQAPEEGKKVSFSDLKVKGSV